MKKKKNVLTIKHVSIEQREVFEVWTLKKKKRQILSRSCRNVDLEESNKNDLDQTEVKFEGVRKGR